MLFGLQQQLVVGFSFGIVTTWNLHTWTVGLVDVSTLFCLLQDIRILSRAHRGVFLFVWCLFISY